MPRNVMTKSVDEYGRCIRYNKTAKIKWENRMLEYMSEMGERKMRGLEHVILMDGNYYAIT